MREFLVEVLGSLVPGIAFLLAVVPAVIGPLRAAVLLIFTDAETAIRVLPATMPESLGTILVLLLPVSIAFLVLAYITGHLFYRQDPKLADQASFQRTSRREHHDGMVRPVQGGGTPVEFPYHYLKQYLIDRGLIYLADRIPWDARDLQRRSKHFVNALKIRINIEAPPHFALLARNEAHVRLSSSMRLLWGRTAISSDRIQTLT